MTQIQSVQIVYLLEHLRPAQKEEDGDDAKLIGLFTSEEKAQAAIARLIDKPGFRDYPDAFHIDAYELDRLHWTSGFGES